MNAKAPRSQGRQGKKRQGEARPARAAGAQAFVRLIFRWPPPQTAGIIGDTSRVRQVPEGCYSARPVRLITR
jgi:hypothetical protein